MDIDFLGEDYIDGCYSGIIRFFENTDNGTHECYSYLYDIELGTINIASRLYPCFKAPIIEEWSKFLEDNYDYIIQLIKNRYGGL